jgi:hypothetical protein
MKKLFVLAFGILFILSVSAFSQTTKKEKKEAKTTQEKVKEDKSAKKESKKDSKKEEKTVKSNDQSGTVYITDKGTSYHKSGCKYLKGGGKAISLTEAKEKYKPCKVCKP